MEFESKKSISFYFINISWITRRVLFIGHKLWIYLLSFLRLRCVQMDLAHTRSVEEVLEHFSVDESIGLTLDEVKLNQEKYGPNGT